MAKIDTNLDQVKQAMINDVASYTNNFRMMIIHDVEQRLKEKGLDKAKLHKSNKKISFITDDQQEYDQGQVYFEEVIENISNKNWLDSI